MLLSKTKKPFSSDSTPHATEISNMPPYQAGFSNSRTWVNPQRQDQQARTAFKNARSKLCPNSTILTADFNLSKHRSEWTALKQRSTGLPTQVSSEGSVQAITREPFSGKTINGHDFIEDYSPVICEKTIFTPQFTSAFEPIIPWPFGTTWFIVPCPKLPKPIAPWPKRDEMKYEGDERISTESIHARCLGLPRVSGNETVNWQHRARVWPSCLDDHTYIPGAAEVQDRAAWIEEIEDLSEMDLGTPVEILGAELLGLLDPVDRI